jgi:hypothetical protein
MFDALFCLVVLQYMVSMVIDLALVLVPFLFCILAVVGCWLLIVLMPKTARSKNRG